MEGSEIRSSILSVCEKMSVDRKQNKPHPEAGMKGRKTGTHPMQHNATLKSASEANINEAAVDCEGHPKRQHNWNFEDHNIPEQLGSGAPGYTRVADDSSHATLLKCNLPLSDTTHSKDAPKERIVPPSSKTPTNSLRIDQFLRPFTLKVVQELLEKTGEVCSFCMDNIKTHCYVTVLHCHIFFSETLKNLVLGGIGSITVVDGSKVEVGDLGNNFMGIRFQLMNQVSDSRRQNVFVPFFKSLMMLLKPNSSKSIRDID